MFATKLTDIQQEVSHTQLLLRFASAFAFFAALFYAIAEIGLLIVDPSLRAMTELGCYLAPHTDSAEAQVVVDALRNNEVYLQSQMLAAQEILLAAHDQYVFWLWKACLVGVWGFGALLYLFQNLVEWWQGRGLPRRCDSRMGIRYEGVFVPCPLPAAQLAALPYYPTRFDRWATALRLAAPRSRPTWATTVQPMSRLAVTLLERYLAYPSWPADVPETHGNPSRHHGNASLGEHVAAVRERALELAPARGLAPGTGGAGRLGSRPGQAGDLPVRGRPLDPRAAPPRSDEQPDPHGPSRVAGAARRRAGRPPDRGPVPSCPDGGPPGREPAGAVPPVDPRPGAQTDGALGDGRSGKGWVAWAGPDRNAHGADATAIGSAGAGRRRPDRGSRHPTLRACTGRAGSGRPLGRCASRYGRGAALGPLPRGDPGGPRRAPAEAPAVAPPPAVAPATTPEAATEARKVVPVQPELVDRLAQALLAALPQLEVNAISMFAGLTIPDTDLVMLLDTRLRHWLCGQLTVQECGQLQISAQEINNTSGSKVLVPHASASNVAAAFRKLGWLVEEHNGQRGTLWHVDVGRRVWLACWLVRGSRLPIEVRKRWPSRPKFTPKPSKPSWIDPWGPIPAAASAASPDAGPQENPGPIQPEGDAAGPAGDREACDPITEDGREAPPRQDGHNG